MLAKADIKSAYRLVPVHPDDRPLLGVQCMGAVYIDAMLPFGLRSAPNIFTAQADAIEWVLRSKGIQHLYHYPDDFIILSPPHTPRCAEDLHRFQSTCEHLGVPLAPQKIVGPATELTSLGININTISGQRAIVTRGQTYLSGEDP